VPVFAVSRFMGTSIAMIDRHYGHLANDSRDQASRADQACWHGRPGRMLRLARRLTRTSRQGRDQEVVSGALAKLLQIV
jgi:hypothetical protein